MKIQINKNILEDKIKLVEKHLQRLKSLQGLSPGRFALPKNFDVAAWNLRCSLEATFNICSHILSRIPGAQVGEYKKMAIEMGKQKIVSMNFAEQKLEKMGGYRNRLTHFYFEVRPEEMYNITQNNLADFEVFLKYIKKFLMKLEKHA